MSTFHKLNGRGSSIISSSLSGLMTARFLLHLREWDRQMSNPETGQSDIPGGDGIQFKKSEPRTTRWTINDVLGDDPLLKPVESEVNLEDSLSPSSASTLPTV